MTWRSSLKRTRAMVTMVGPLGQQMGHLLLQRLYNGSYSNHHNNNNNNNNNNNRDHNHNYHFGDDIFGRGNSNLNCSGNSLNRGISLDGRCGCS